MPKASDIEAWSKCFPRRQLGDALGLKWADIGQGFSTERKTITFKKRQEKSGT